MDIFLDRPATRRLAGHFMPQTRSKTLAAMAPAAPIAFGRYD